MKAKTIVKNVIDKYESGALQAVKDAKYWFKKGFHVTGPDHTHTDTEEWEELCEAEKMIKKQLRQDTIYTPEIE